ncbi:TolC family protein [Persicobacter sp. CCB-QB2]|uniref:TolC family protein n=1 Tax=Persicobacter sp. CCB-QB2 TaxID=1561025 RepID=UPI0006A9C106|nr:TolC family protein [Persicobacter sp. CCB-QB2]
MKKLILILAVTALAFRTYAQPQVEELDSTGIRLTLQEALLIGLENNFELQLSRNGQRLLTNEVALGNAGFLPRVNLNGGLNGSVNNTEQAFHDSERDANTIYGARSHRYNANVGVEWRLFDGLQMFAAYDQLQALEQQGNYNLQAAINAKLAEIGNVFLALALEEHKLGVIKEKQALSALRLEISENKYSIGKASRPEFLAAQVDFNADRSEVVRQIAVINNLRTELNRLMGIPDLQSVYAVAFEFTYLEDLSVDQMLESGLNMSPELMAAHSQETIAYLERKKVLAERYPTLDANLSYGYNRNASQAGVMAYTQTMGFDGGLTLRWNIYGAGDVKRKIQRAKIEQESAAIALQDQQQLLESNILRNFQDYSSYVVLVEVEKDNVEVARENTEYMFERYKIGKSSFVELREAQRSQAEAAIRYLEAAYLVNQSQMELKRLTGEIGALVQE